MFRWINVELMSLLLSSVDPPLLHLQSPSDVGFRCPGNGGRRTKTAADEWRAAAVIISTVCGSTRKERLTFGSCWSGRRGDFRSPSEGPGSVRERGDDGIEKEGRRWDYGSVTIAD